jgi:hypothetical protein
MRTWTRLQDRGTLIAGLAAAVSPIVWVSTNYPKGQWIIRERERLTYAIERAAGENTGREERAV